MMDTRLERRWWRKLGKGAAWRVSLPQTAVHTRLDHRSDRQTGSVTT